MSFRHESPEDRLYAAISILQAHYLAEDTALKPERIFGPSTYFRDSGLEHTPSTC